MKRQLLFTLLIAGLFSIFGTQKAQATHAAGGELLYEWVRDSTYRIIFKFYRDCGSAQYPSTATAPTSVSVCYYNDCGGNASSVTLPRISDPKNGSEVSPGCPGFPTRCAFGTLPGYQEWIYAAEVTLPTRCHTWHFFTGINARNQSINNLVNPGSQTLWIEATLNNQVAQGNSSPYFSVKPVPYVCVGMPYTYNNGAVDVNSDSLYFESIQPLTGSTSCNSPVGTPIAYAGGFSITEPFATGNTYHINNFTGQISFTPTIQQMSVITTKVYEYRNGVQIGSVMRDIQVVVVPCTIPQPIVEIDTPSLQNAVLVGDRIEGCSGNRFSFCIDLKSPDTSAILVTTDNSNSAIPGAILTYSGQGSDSIRACIDWTPSYLDTGLRILTFTVKDSTCRPPGIPIMQTFVIPVYIWPATGILKDTSLCPGDSVQLVAVGGSNFQWGVLPGGSPLSSLSCNNCQTPIARPDKSTFYYVIAENSTVCNKNSDTVSVAVVTPPVIDLGPDITTCVNNPLQLNLNLPAGTGTNYQIQWSPSTYLDDPTSATPIADLQDDITYTVVVRPNGLDHCNARDTINITVLKGYELYNSDTIICDGYTVQTNVIGDSRYTYKWTPSKGVSNVNQMSPTITTDSTRRYVLTASYPGCRDSVRSFEIEVQPIPIVFAGDDIIICHGDTLRLAPTVEPGYSNYTYTWDPAGGLEPGPNVAGPLYTGYQTNTLTLTVTTPIGCTGSDDILVTVASPDIIEATNDTLICPGDTIQLHVWGNQVSQVWIPAYYISDTLSADPYVYPITSTTYTVYGTDIDECMDTATVHVRVLPQAVLSLPDSVRIYPGEAYQMEPGGNCLYFEWFPPLGLSDHRIPNPTAQPEVNTRYFVTARTESGCLASDSIDVFVNLDSYIDVPNAFAPGGSGPNRTLRPVRRGYVTLKNFAVYNRWGVKLFETKNLDEGWDGSFNGEPQPMGVYVYIVEAVTPTGREVRKQGNTTLLR